MWLNKRNFLIFWQPFKFIGSTPVIKVLIEKKSFNIILDTGAHCSCLDKSILEDCKLPFQKIKYSNFGVGGESKVYGMSNIEFKIGDSVFINTFELVDLQEAMSHFLCSKRNIPKGLLGSDFFKSQNIIIDYNKQGIYIIK